MKITALLGLFCLVVLQSSAQIQANQVTFLQGGQVHDQEFFANTNYIATNGGVFKMAANSSAWVNDNTGMGSIPSFSVQIKNLVVFGDQLIALSRSGVAAVKRSGEDWSPFMPEYIFVDIEVFQGELYAYGYLKDPNLWFQDYNLFQIDLTGQVTDMQQTMSFYFFGPKKNLRVIGNKLTCLTPNSLRVFDGNQFTTLPYPPTLTLDVFGVSTEEIFAQTFTWFGPSTILRINNIYRLEPGKGWQKFNIDTVSTTYLKSAFVLEGRLNLSVYEQTEASVTPALYSKVDLPIAGTQWVRNVTTSPTVELPDGMVKVSATSYIGYSGSGVYTTNTPFTQPTTDLNNGFYGTQHQKSLFNGDTLISLVNYQLNAWNRQGQSIPITAKNADDFFNHKNKLYTISGGVLYEYVNGLSAPPNRVEVNGTYVSSIFPLTAPSKAILFGGLDFDAKEAKNILLDLDTKEISTVNFEGRPIIFRRLIWHKNKYLGLAFSLKFQGNGAQSDTIFLLKSDDGINYKMIDYGYEKDTRKEVTAIYEANDSLIVTVSQMIWTGMAFEANLKIFYLDPQQDQLVYLGTGNRVIKDVYYINGNKFGLIESVFEGLYEETAPFTWAKASFNGIPEGAIVSSVFYDNSGTAYLGTDGNGIFRLEIPASLGEFSSNKLLQVYPNPAQSVINIPINSGGAEIELYTTGGRLIKKTTLSGNDTAVLDINDLTPGLYIGRRTQGSETKAFVIVKQ
ncbi:MAG TPA: T9SS type A sorting domain-containing protein [Luteibaculaceae bacterium]|nr:T9SS type A sorting domain-containing protein [Luteibaculaceae bacterium]